MVEAIFLLCAISPGYMTSGLQEQYMKQLRRVAPFAYIKRSPARREAARLSPFSSAAAARRCSSRGRTMRTSRSRGRFCGSCCSPIAVPSAMAAPLAEKAPARSTGTPCSTACRWSIPMAPTLSRGNSGSFAGIRPGCRDCGRFSANPFPDGWKANLRGVDLNLNYPASWDLAKQIKAGLGFDCAAPRDFPGKKPLDQRETAALAAYTACIRPDILLAYHTQGRVIYPGGRDLDPPGAEALAEQFSEASGYAVEDVPPESSNAGFKDWFLRRFHRPALPLRQASGKIRFPHRSCRSSSGKTNPSLPSRSPISI